ncbi:hypothetical protein SDC9_181069 [bioreactor metagenome]|uniref:SH3b domain-containing protein n=1 Tax=bioreactor metagenome TaxID=1076179 RepID=A0A645H4G9_9ZZZZ
MGVYMGGELTFNSSQKGGGVAASTRFGGQKAVPNGGWNMVGLPRWVDCGLTDAQMAALLGDANATAEEPAEDAARDAQAAAEANVLAAGTIAYATVVTPDGNPVKVREQPRKDAVWKFKIPSGTRVQLLGESGNYYRVHWLGRGRWVQKDFLQTL